MCQFTTKKGKRFVFVWVTIILSSLSVYIIPLIKFSNEIIARDWTLFNCFSYFTKSCFFHYKTFPIHNPYVLGGLDQIAAPQAKTFSPLSTFDLFLSPPYANLLSLITLSIIGGYGAYKLFTFLKISSKVSILCTILYMHASWFSLHFTEGHVVYGSFQLMCLVFYYTLNLHKNHTYVHLAALLAFMLLDGGFYAFIYSITFIFFSYLVSLEDLSFKVLFRDIKNQKIQFFLACFIFFGLSAAKLVPFLLLHHGRPPVLESIQLDLNAILFAFFSPFQEIHASIPNTTFYKYDLRFHEISTYIGVVSFLIITLFLIKNFRVKFLSYLLLLCFFFWIGTGLGNNINPWKVFQQVPFINSAHVQTRVLFFVYFLLLILLAYALNFYSKKWSKATRYLFAVLLIVESLWISSYSFYKIYEYPDSYSSFEVFSGYIQNNSVERTIASPGNGWGKDFELYMKKNVSSKTFGDNAVVQGEIKVEGEEDYKGEVYFLSGKGNVKVLKYDPSGLIFSVNTERPSQIQFNTNFLLNWVSFDERVSVYEKSGLVTVEVPKMSDTVILKYRPNYIYIIFPLYILSIVAFLFVIINRKNKGKMESMKNRLLSNYSS